VSLAFRQLGRSYPSCHTPYCILLNTNKPDRLTFMDATRREYKKRHQKLHYYRGSASDFGPCVDCGEAKSEWSQVRGTTGLDLYNDYVPRCRNCHLAYDRPKPTPKPRKEYAYRLSWSDVSEIRERAANGETHRKLAREFGISRAHVTNIVAERTRGRLYRTAP
jgi:hypothetical protein